MCSHVSIIVFEPLNVKILCANEKMFSFKCYLMFHYIAVWFIGDKAVIDCCISYRDSVIADDSYQAIMQSAFIHFGFLLSNGPFLVVILYHL